MESMNEVAPLEPAAVEARAERGFSARRRLGLIAGTALLSVVAACNTSEQAGSPTSAPSATAEAKSGGEVAQLSSPSSVPEQPIEPSQTISAAPEGAAPHNVMYIMVDDMQMKLFKREYMPITFREIVDKGVVGKNAIAPQGLCCPARSSFFQGQYSHNTGVWSNSYPTGGYERYRKNGEEKSSIFTWLNKAGYKVALIGKYLNNYPYNFHKPSEQYVADKHVPAGIDDLVTPIGGSPYGQKRFKLNVRGKVDRHMRSMATNPRNYLNDTLTRYTGKFIRNNQNKPWFALMTPYSVHGPSTPAPQDAHLKVDTRPITSDPAFNLHASDKPLLKNLPPLTKSEKRQILHNWVQRVRTIKDVDRSVGRIIRWLKRTDQYDKTDVFFTSDNAYHLGEFRMPSGKNTPYRFDTDVPFAAEGPDVVPGTELQQVVANVDMSATVLDIANAKPPRRLDGKSFLPLLQGKRMRWAGARLLERGDSQGYSVTADGVNEPADNPREDGLTSTVPYEGIREERRKYIVYRFKAGEDNSTKPAEMYDLDTDPHELHNLLGKRQKFVNEIDRQVYGGDLKRLRSELGQLATCKGADCQVYLLNETR
jgi:N-acetylglucosamine-6-sulfatase